LRTALPVILILLVVALPQGCKKQAPSEKAPVKSSAKNAETDPDATPASTEDAGTEPGPDLKAPHRPPEIQVEIPQDEPPDTSTITWRIEPATLDVMRDTSVRLSLFWPSVPVTDFRCFWNPGDRSGELVGCNVEHLYQGGMADREVTVRVEMGGKVQFNETRPLPLEKLPVAPLASKAAELPPKPGEGGVRTVFAGLFVHPDDEQIQQLAATFDQLSPDLVFLYLNYKAPSKKLAALLDRLNTGKAWTALPIYCAGSSGGAPKVQSSRLLMHGEGNDPPYRYSFLTSGVLFVVLDPRQDTYDKNHEKWMLSSLESGAMATHRVAVSCAPMEKYTPKERAILQPGFRYYEKLLRGDVSLLVSSTYPVFYHALYGYLKTVSVGCAAGKPGQLLSARRAQTQALTLVDFREDSDPKVYPVTTSTPLQILDQSGLPFKVGTYLKEL